MLHDSSLLCTYFQLQQPVNRVQLTTLPTLLYFDILAQYMGEMSSRIRNHYVAKGMAIVPCPIPGVVTTKSGLRPDAICTRSTVV